MRIWRHLYLVNDTPSSIDAIASNKTVLFFKILYDFKHSVLYEFYATVTLSNIEWCCCCDYDKINIKLTILEDVLWWRRGWWGWRGWFSAQDHLITKCFISHIWKFGWCTCNIWRANAKANKRVDIETWDTTYIIP